jgi:hypothetical protein
MLLGLPSPSGLSNVSKGYNNKEESTIPAGRERQRAVFDRRRRILSAELIEDQKTRLFHSYLGASLFKNSNINGHGNSTESERNNRNTSRK